MYTVSYYIALYYMISWQAMLYCSMTRVIQDTYTHIHKQHTLTNIKHDKQTYAQQHNTINY